MKEGSTEFTEKGGVVLIRERGKGIGASACCWGRGGLQAGARYGKASKQVAGESAKKKKGGAKFPTSVCEHRNHVWEATKEKEMGVS